MKPITLILFGVLGYLAYRMFLSKPQTLAMVPRPTSNPTGASGSVLAVAGGVLSDVTDIFNNVSSISSDSDTTATI